MKKSCFPFLLALALFSCSPSSNEEFREAGRSINRSLIKELQGVRSRSDLTASLPTLEHLFERLVDVMIAARKFQMAQKSNEPFSFSKEDLQISDLLRTELNRIYRLPGGKELIEKAQQRSLDRLDRFYTGS